MSLVLPDWVSHDMEGDGQVTKRVTIFSIHVHPDGSRIATAGLDSKIKVWATAPILDPKVESDSAASRLLCTLARHSGSVLVVRWSASGRFLASGSDDTIAMVWDLDPTGLASGSVFGASDAEANIEAWRPHRRLAAHESDVVDLAWSTDTDDAYLATVGLDSAVYVWSGPRPGPGSFERIKKIDGHAGFVKGVVWDPVGAFLATASDDKSVRIWNVEKGFTEEVVVTAPFKTSPSTIFFSRPSWSPDGAHLLCANGMSGPVFVATVVERPTPERGSWTSDIHLVGHENSVIATAFSPKFFKSRDPHPNPSPATVLALGSLDESISIWITGQQRPLLVSKHVFERQPMDLSWSSDGLTLYACSADGRVAAFMLNEEILSPLETEEKLETARASFGWRKSRRVLYQVPPAPPAQHIGSDGTNVLIPRRRGVPPLNGRNAGTSAPAGSTPQRLVQNITRDAKGRRRIQPTLVGSGSNPGSDYQAALRSSDDNAMQIDGTLQHVGPSLLPALGGYGQLSAAHTFASTSATLAELLDADASTRRGKDVGRTLGGESSLKPPLQVMNLGLPNAAPSHFNPPSILSFYTREGPGCVFEAYNSIGGNTQILLRVDDGKGIAWIDVLHSPVIAATSTSSFTAVSLENREVLIYSQKGRRVSSFILEHHVFRAEASGNTLVIVDLNADLRRWNVELGESNGQLVSVKGLIQSPTGANAVKFWVHGNGSPVFILSDETAYTLNAAQAAWTCVSSGWWAVSSAAWDARARGRESVGASASNNDALAGSLAREPVKYIERAINDLRVSSPDTARQYPSLIVNGSAESEASIACTLRHLESRLLAAELLESPLEYRSFLQQYARKLADEGIRNMAEELIKSFLGPIYYKTHAQETWKPQILGLNKRELLAEVLKIMAKSRLLPGLVQTYAEHLRNVSAR
ncbi:Histone transcription regulator HIRA, WD repeat superfamily [Ceraceosorus bombacis]|uniref:Protein HIR n=1 Tax=Ceraceosorus bombacis TaxID=401625 RepID=A0A0P1BJ37_9BASI|nr:Histone transcription regulator HIRA, WD repeat superfamily [Ceraceosorus bombacis]